MCTIDAPGDVRGFDVRTGEELWEFHTIPQPGEFGNETWENGSWEYSGSTNAWGMLTADPELGYVYLPIGTPTLLVVERDGWLRLVRDEDRADASRHVRGRRARRFHLSARVTEIGVDPGREGRRRRNGCRYV